MNDGDSAVFSFFFFHFAPFLLSLASFPFSHGTFISMRARSALALFAEFYHFKIVFNTGPAHIRTFAVCRFAVDLPIRFSVQTALGRSRITNEKKRFIFSAKSINFILTENTVCVCSMTSKCQKMHYFP